MSRPPARAGTSAERNARYYAKPKNVAKRKAHDKKRNAEKKVVSKGIEVPAVLEYRRGVLHGLTCARSLVYNYNGGRSWSNIEIAGQISDFVQDLPAAIVVIGDILDANDEVPARADVREAFWRPRRKS